MTRTSASSVPPTCVTAVVNPWMTPRLSDGVCSRRSNGVLRRPGDVVARAALEYARRHRALGGDRDAGRLLQRRVELHTVAGVVDVRDERLVLVALESAVGDLDLAIDVRLAERARRSSRRR